MITSGSMRCLDAALHLLQPVRMLLSFVALVALVVARIMAPTHAALAHAFWFALPAWVLAAAVFIVYPLVILATERKFLRALPTYALFVLYSFTWIPAVVVGLLRLRRRVWIHTSHGAAASQHGTRGKDPTMPGER